MEKPKQQSIRESFAEILLIIKACLTCAWFWLPPLFAVYFYFQFYLMCINPLLLAIGPIVLSIYAMLREEKRLKAKYGIKDVRVLSSSAPLFSAPQRVKVESQIEKLLEEYEQTLKKKREKLRE